MNIQRLIPNTSGTTLTKDSGKMTQILKKVDIGTLGNGVPTVT